MPTAELQKNIQPQRSHQAPALASALYNIALVVTASFCFMHRHVVFVDDESTINIEQFFFILTNFKIHINIKNKNIAKEVCYQNKNKQNVYF